MNQPADITALARRLEANELAAWRAMYQAPAPEIAALLGLGYAEQAGALLIWNRAAPVFVFNRLLALGVFEPATDQAIDALLARAQAEQSRCYVQATPAAQPADLAARLEARGRQREMPWLQHFRYLDGSPPNVVASEYRIEPVTPASAAAWADAIIAGWGVPTWAATGVLALLVPLAQQPEWRCYAAVHATTGLTVGGGALFVAGGVGGLYTDGVRGEHRGRGIQEALIAARLAEAQRQRCTLACAQTPVAHTAQRNMERAGFQVAYERPHYVTPNRS